MKKALPIIIIATIATFGIPFLLNNYMSNISKNDPIDPLKIPLIGKWEIIKNNKLPDSEYFSTIEFQKYSILLGKDDKKIRYTTPLENIMTFECKSNSELSNILKWTTACWPEGTREQRDAGAATLTGRGSRSNKLDLSEWGGNYSLKKFNHSLNEFVGFEFEDDKLILYRNRGGGSFLFAEYKKIPD